MIIVVESNQNRSEVPTKVQEYFINIMEKYYPVGYALVIRCVTDYYKMNIVKLKGTDRMSTERFGVCAIKYSTGEVFANAGGLCKLNSTPCDKISLQ